MTNRPALLAGFIAALAGPVLLAASSPPPESPLTLRRGEESLVQPVKIKGAAPDRLFEFGIAFGMPILASPEVAVQLFKKFQFGSYFGMVPGGVIPRFTLPPITQQLFNGLSYQLHPSGDTSLFMVSPFVRFFPTERTFYFQLTWSVAQSTHNVVSPLTETITGITIPGASITSLVTITEMLPTLSIGYFFWRHVYFFNINLGATFLMTPRATATLSADLPLGLGGTLNNQAALNSIQNQIDTSMNKAIEEVRNVFPFVPSIMISTGIMF